MLYCLACRMFVSRLACHGKFAQSMSCTTCSPFSPLTRMCLYLRLTVGGLGFSQESLVS